MDRFQLFRLSLTPRGDLFSPEPPTREEYLRRLFARQHDFEHRGNPFVYLPVKDQPFPYMLGQIGRPFVRVENLPPEQGFAVAQHEGWRAAVLAVDPTSHQDGQKVSFSDDTIIGKPFAVLRSFIRHLNSVEEDPPYHIEVEPIFNTRSFWAFAEEHKGEVTSLKFEFVTPNIFGSADALSEELRGFRKDEHAQTVELKLRSEDGINTDTDRIRVSVEYAGKGAGKVIAFAKGGRHYNSQEQVETVLLEGDDEEPLVIRALRRIREVLGL